MSQCPYQCSTCAEEAQSERCACAREQASVQACQWGPLPYPDLNLLDPLPLAFPCKEAPHKDAHKDRGDSRPGQVEGSSLLGTPVLDTLDKVIEEGDRILAALPPQSWDIAEIHASQTTLQRLAEAFTQNMQPKSFQDAVPDYLHDFEDVFSKTSFDSLPECKQSISRLCRCSQV